MDWRRLTPWSLGGAVDALKTAFQARGSSEEPSKDSAQDKPSVLPWRSPSPDYSKSIERGFRLAAQRIGEEASRADDLLAQPSGRRRMLVENSDRLRNVRTCSDLLDYVQKAWFFDTDEALSLAELALQIARSLRAEFHRAALVKDLEARALAYRGNIRRIRSDLQEAEADLEQAAALLLAGTGDPLLRGETASLVTSLRIDQGRTNEALIAAESALQIYRQIDQHNRAGRVLIQRGLIYGSTERPAEAIACLAEAEKLIDKSEDPNSALVIAHNLTTYKTMQGAFLEAQALLAKNRSLYEEHGTPRLLLRKLWLEGSISLGTGQLRQAEEQLTSARQQFVELSLPYEQALVSLDLALLFLQKGHTAKVKELAQEMVAFFRSRQVHRETLAAAILFHRATKTEAVTQHFVRELSSYLTKAQADPSQRFRPAS